MTKVNKFWLCVLLAYILATPYYLYASSSKQHSQEQPKYELKSDVLNFDYSQLAYPYNAVTIGIKYGTTNAPKKIVPGKPEEESHEGHIREGLLYFSEFFIGAIMLYFIFAILPCFSVEASAFLCRKIRDKKKNNKN